MNEDHRITATVVVVSIVAYALLSNGLIPTLPGSRGLPYNLVTAFLIGVLSLYFFDVVEDIVTGLRDMWREAR